MSGYTLTATAEADVLDILQFIAARDGMDRALHIHDKFVDAFELLSATPFAGKVRPELTSEHVRWWPVSTFLVVYDAKPTPIDILRVIYGGRDLPSLF